MADRYFVPFGGADIYDQIKGCGRPDTVIAQCEDGDTAHRIAKLLNADERLKEQARLGARKEPA